MQNVSKRFLRGVRHDPVRDLVPPVVRRMLKLGPAPAREPFWALRDVSFEVGPGEALGIIGPNGAGKSTVLKLITRILRPEAGRVVVRGPGRGRTRVGALIELAAGFHYELTGRENVYLQGAVLGMSRREIAARFEEIVEFAELAEFIDTPVKRYSSGMVARLGFAIAAHVDADILIIDEVLSVGDMRFQQKAFAQLQEAVRRDVPAVVVSHQLHRVVELCEQAILLSGGRVVAQGAAEDCVARYVQEPVRTDADNALPIELHELLVSPPSVRPGERVHVRLRGIVGSGCPHPERLAAGVRLRSIPREEIVFAVNSAASGVQLPSGGAFELDIDLQMNVPPGIYRLQGVAWDLGDRRELYRAAGSVIAVEGHPATYGPVFPDPRMRIRGI